MPIRPIKPQNTVEPAKKRPRVRTRSRPSELNNENIAASEARDEQQPPESTSSYTVGYGKPPVAAQFKPGKSGNPRGRPKAAKGLNTIVRDTLTQKVSVRTSAGEKRISRIEAALHKTIELAMKGNPRALAELIKLYNNAVPDEKVTADQRRHEEDLTATDVAMLEELRLLLTTGGEQGHET